MKKRIRKTGEIVDIISYSNPFGSTRTDDDFVSYIDSKGFEHPKEKGNYYWDFDNISDENLSNIERTGKNCKEIDWEERRFLVAKDIFIHYLDNSYSYSYNAQEAIIAAGAFVSRYKDFNDEFRKRHDENSHEVLIDGLRNILANYLHGKESDEVLSDFEKVLEGEK